MAQPAPDTSTPKLTDAQKVVSNLLVALLPHYLLKYHRTHEALSAAMIDVEIILAEVRAKY